MELWTIVLLGAVTLMVDNVKSVCTNTQETDLVFVLDSSSSINNTQLHKQLTFSQSIVKDFVIGFHKTRVSLIIYSDDVKEVFPLNHNKAQVYAAISRTISTLPRQRLHGGSNAADAIKHLWQKTTVTSRRSARKIAIIITDGKAYYPRQTKFHAAVARTLRKIKMVAIGVGNHVNTSRLADIANNKALQFKAFTFDGLPMVARDIRQALDICHPYPPGRTHKPEVLGGSFDILRPPMLIRRRPPPVASLRFAPPEEDKPDSRRPCRGDLCVGEGQQVTTTASPGDGLTTSCGGKPADIVFVLDSSSSIWFPDFSKQLDFVNSIVDIFDISSNTTRVGVMTFSDMPKMEFGLKAYKTKKSLQRAISNISHTLGDTYTANALEYMHTEMFSPKSGARHNVAHVAVIITDGHSVSRHKTVQQADRARNYGIHLITIGVGRDVDEDELKGIANDPDDDNVFRVDNYRALDSIKELLAIRTCKVKPTSTPITQACGIRGPTDIAFIMDTPNAGPTQTKQLTQFVKSIVRGMEISEEHNQIALIPKQCISTPGFSLNSNTNRDNVLEQLTTLDYPETDKLVQEMRDNLLNEEYGARKKSRKLAILISDRDVIENFGKTAQQIERSKSQNIEIFTVGVGNLIERPLRELASAPPDRHVFSAKNHGEVKNLVQDVLKKICGVSYSMMMEHRRTGRRL